MKPYADPQRCPDCRHLIAQGAISCANCHLSLAGPLAAELFSTLSHADELLLALRNSAPALVGVASPAPGSSNDTPVDGPVDGPVATTPLVWAPNQVLPSVNRGLSAASVPKILLGLGAVCLLVAALVFLAVTWSVLGVAGRTAILVGFTAVTATLATWACNRDLRAGAESLTVVALGLLSFDLLGARDSGWLGDIGTPTFAVVLGAVVVTASIAIGWGARRTPVRTLLGAELMGTLGTATLAGGIVAGPWLDPAAALTLVVLLCAAVSYIVRLVGLRGLALGTGAVSAFGWLALASTALDRAVSHPSASELWLELEAWPMVVAASLAGSLALVRTLPTAVRVAGAAVAEVVLIATGLIPFAQHTATEFTLAVLATLVAACALTWFARDPWSWGCAVTTTLCAGWVVLVGGFLSLLALIRLGRAGGAGWTGSYDGRFAVSDLGSFDPWLLPLVTIAVLGTVVVLARTVPLVDRVLAPLDAPFLAVAAAAAVAGVVGTAVLYRCPVWVAVLIMLLAAAAFMTWCLRRRQPTSLVLGAGFLCAAVATSFYDQRLTAAALAVTLCTSAAVRLRWIGARARIVADTALALALAGSVWTWGNLGGVDATWVSLWAVIALGLLLLVAPGVGVELGAPVAVIVTASAGVAAASYASQPTWTAVYLTAAGVAASLVALLRADRRPVGWLGAGLLAAASWVRLWDLGVQAPEAYTLPSAALLTVSGLFHLRNRSGGGTMTALSPALCLALVPSLLWVLWEPAGLRAVLLGSAALALVMLGLRLRWSAPVLFGAGVGALVVLRQLVPAADAVPQWVLIGSAGALLVVIGITWERRIQEARMATSYLRALR